MKFFPIILLLVTSFIVSATTAFYISQQRPDHERQESVYERVLRTGTLRCGWFVEAPFASVDPATGKKSGLAVDLTEKIAGELGLKVEWVAEINFATVADDLSIGRFDAVCGDLFTMPRAGRMDYTLPYAHVPVYAYTQKDRYDFDNRLAVLEPIPIRLTRLRAGTVRVNRLDLNKLEHFPTMYLVSTFSGNALDWSTIKVAGLDGEGATTAARKKIPQARFITLPQSAQIADMLTSVVNRKADIAFVMPTVFRDFDKSNAGKLRKVESSEPFHMFNVAFGVKPGEAALKNMLDIQIRNAQADGTLRRLFEIYDPEGLLFPSAPLYREARK